MSARVYLAVVTSSKLTLRQIKLIQMYCNIPCNRYGSVKEAREHEDGVVVLAVWLRAAAGDSEDVFSLLEE